jgi:hypothetical protein
MSRLAIFFIEPTPDRWFKGDHRWRAKVRRVIRGPDPVGGIKLVYINLVKGLDRIGADYVTNIAYDDIRPDDLVGVVGNTRTCLDGYRKPNPILAGVAVAAHPMEWPTLFEDHPVARYVVHCDWVKAMYERHYGPRVSTWAVGIDTDRWRPSPASTKSVDFLIYDKVRWDYDRVHRAMVEPIREALTRRGLSYEIIRYGNYTPPDLLSALTRAKALLFLCEHETQGLAYQQAMSCDVPVLAWDPGVWLDPWRYRYGESHVPATSVPFFDERCGETFLGVPDFEEALEAFMDRQRIGALSPRQYVLENLTLEICARNYVKLLEKFCVRQGALT